MSREPQEPETLEQESAIRVRTLEARDLDAMVRIDAIHAGRTRREFYAQRLKRALEESGIRMSLVAEEDGAVVGFLLGSVCYGEFGRPEPTASLEAIGVHPRHARRGVAQALWRQFVKNVRALRIDRVETHVGWDSWGLLSFLHEQGFRPAQRICLERGLTDEE